MSLIFETQNAKLSASLVIKKIQPIRIEKIEGETNFIFQNSPKLREIKTDFYNGRLKISNGALIDQLAKMRKL